mgnify:CR=1 FL=1
MCGRFALTMPTEAMESLFEAEAQGLPETGPRHNVCPTQEIAAVVSWEEGRLIVPMRWGFIPRWYKSPTDGPLLINARAETIADKPAFREAARARRCLIPASGFFEWTKGESGKEPWYIHPREGEAMAMAGVWQRWMSPEGESLVTTAIVTCAANQALSKLHHRMPVVLACEDWGLWLGEEGKGAAALMQPAPEDALAFHRVSTAVNSMKARGPELLEPVA